MKLSDGPVATVLTFDIEQIILSLITDDSLMSKGNIAKGYDLHTGSVTVNAKRTIATARLTQVTHGNQPNVTTVAARANTCLFP